MYLFSNKVPCNACLFNPFVFIQERTINVYKTRIRLLFERYTPKMDTAC